MAILVSSCALPLVSLEMCRNKTPRVRERELLGRLDATNTPLPEAARPAICADPNTKHPATGESVFCGATCKSNVEMMQALLAAGADPCATNDGGGCPLESAAQFAPDALAVCADAPDVRERVEATLELCAQRQVGVSYAEHLADLHVASLAVGTAVAWTQTLVRP